MIDAHVHFWQLARGDYNWIGETRPLLNKDFLPDDFLKISEGAGVTGCIAVQAAPTNEETRFLLNLAQDYHNIVGVTGWLDLTAPDVSQQLAQLVENSKLVGIRPMAGVSQGERWLNTKEYSAGLNQLDQCNLVLEALALPHHVNAIADIANLFPELRIVLNHAAKPTAADLPRWIKDIGDMATLENTYCKVSGFTQQSSDSDHHQRVFDKLLSVFGPKRLLWGSDYPVLLETADYKSWTKSSEMLWATLSSDEVNQIKCHTAKSLYRLA